MNLESQRLIIMQPFTYAPGTATMMFLPVKVEKLMVLSLECKLTAIDRRVSHSRVVDLDGGVREGIADFDRVDRRKGSDGAVSGSSSGGEDRSCWKVMLECHLQLFIRKLTHCRSGCKVGAWGG